MHRRDLAGRVLRQRGKSEVFCEEQRAEHLSGRVLPGAALRPARLPVQGTRGRGGLVHA
jgi:hypothetical protein